MACNTEDLNPSEIILGCTDPAASNFNVNATVDDGGCIFESPLISGCTDPDAINYNPAADIETDDCGCIYEECPPSSAITISIDDIVYFQKPTVNDSGDNQAEDTSSSTAARNQREVTIGGNFTNIELSEECCNEEIVGQPVVFQDEKCRLVQPTGCPPNLATNINGVLLNGDTGIPVTEECCNNQEGYQYLPNFDNGDGTFGACLEIDFLVEECNINLDSIDYLTDGTVVYNTTVPTTPNIPILPQSPNQEITDERFPPNEGGGTSTGGTNEEDNSTGSGNVNIEESCLPITSWFRSSIDGNPNNVPSEDIVSSGLISIINPNDPNQPYPANTWLFTFRTSDNEEAYSLTQGDTLFISGLNLTSPSNSYNNDIVPILTTEVRITGKDFDSELEETIIYTDLEIGDYVNVSTSVGRIQNSTTGQACLQPSEGVEYYTEPEFTWECPADPSCDEGCGNPITVFNDYTLKQPISSNTNNLQNVSTNSFWGYQPIPNSPTVTITQTNQIASITMVDGLLLQFNGDDFLIQIYDGSGTYNQTDLFGNQTNAGQLIGDRVVLNNCFWNNLACSCFAPYIKINGNQWDGTTPEVVYIVGKEAEQLNRLYLSISISSDDIENNNLINLPPPSTLDGTGCDTNQSGNYQVCVPGTNIGQTTNGGTTNFEQRGVRLPSSPIIFDPSPISTTPTGPALNPCELEEDQPSIPAPPSLDNNYENLSEACCLTLSPLDEDGNSIWQYIGDVCYWNPPPGQIASEFGLSESEIVVSDTDCTLLDINASFYLERPDSVDCQITDGQDITASLIAYTDDQLSATTTIPTTVISTFNLSSNGYCQWTDISSTIANDFTTPFKIKLVLNGVKDCCEYDFFVDDISVNCQKQDALTGVTFNDCPGFKLNKVIDNKKSWVNNVETPINRTFAPSSNAEIPWRYTNYLEQSGVYENDSRLVLNSKEMYLNFNMKKVQPKCPEGFVLFNGSCVKQINTCPSGFTLSGETCVSGGTTTSATTENTFYPINRFGCDEQLSIFELIEYKKNFQSFWVKFIEQFVPATTIFVSGEKWSNKNDDICDVVEPCNYINNFSELDLGLRTTNGVAAPQTRNKNINKSSDVFVSSDKVLSEKDGDYGDNKSEGPILLKDFTAYFLKKEDSILSQERLTLKSGELTLLKKGQKDYQNKFTPRLYKVI